MLMWDVCLFVCLFVHCTFVCVCLCLSTHWRYVLHRAVSLLCSRKKQQPSFDITIELLKSGQLTPKAFDPLELVKHRNGQPHMIREAANKALREISQGDKLCCARGEWFCPTSSRWRPKQGFELHGMAEGHTKGKYGFTDEDTARAWHISPRRKTI